MEGKRGSFPTEWTNCLRSASSKTGSLGKPCASMGVAEGEDKFPHHELRRSVGQNAPAGFFFTSKPCGNATSIT